MLERQWYAIAVSIDPATGMVTLDQRPLSPMPGSPTAPMPAAGLAVSPKAVDSAALHGGLSGGRRHHWPAFRRQDRRPADPVAASTPPTATMSFCDAIVRRRFCQHIIARWDFSKDIRTTTQSIDIGPSQHHGRIVHLPARGMKGWNWTGEEHSWTRKPEHYGAIHFHSDDLYDAGWETSVESTIPADLKSGPYALHVKCGESDARRRAKNYIAFFVRPPR